MAGRVQEDKIQVRLQINGEEVKNSYNDLRKAAKDLNKVINEAEKGTENWIKASKDLAKVKQRMKEIKDAQDSIVKSQGFLTKAFGKVGTAIKGAFAPLLALSLVTELVNLTKAAFDASKEIQKVMERTNQLTGLVGDGLADATAKADALGNAFEVDVKQGMDAANAAANVFVKEGENVGDVYTKALDEMSKRLAALPDDGEEFLTQIDEYSVKAADAGLSMERFFNITAASINKGVPTDKLIDSIKEFDIRIKDLSKGQRETLENTFGKQFTDELVTGIETGKTSSIEALELISAGMEDMGETSASTQKVLSNLFGGAGEDASARYLEIINETGESLSNVADTTNIYTQRRLELYELEQKASKATAELAFALDGTNEGFQKIWLFLKTYFIEILTDVVTFIRYFPEYFEAATSSGKAFVNGMIDLFQYWIDNSLSPIVLLIEKLTGKELKLPKFDIEDDPFSKVEAKIEADRKAFEERQRQNILKGQGATEDAQKLQAIHAARERARAIANAEAEELAKLKKAAKNSINNLGSFFDPTGEDEGVKMFEKQAEEKIKVLMEQKEKERAIEEEFYTWLAEIDRQRWEDQKAMDEARRQQAIALTERAVSDLVALFDMISEAQNVRDEARLAEIEANKERELKLVGDNEKKKRRIEIKSDKEKEAIEKRIAKRRQQQSIIQAIIATAQSIVETGKLGYPQAIPFQIIAAAIGAAQIATIKAQKFATGGIPAGSTHAQGGISMYDNRSGRYVGEMEGGEPIISRATYANNRAIVDRLLYSGQHRGGAPVYETGGIAPTPTATPSNEAVSAARSSNDSAMIIAELQRLNANILQLQLSVNIGEPEIDAISTVQAEIANRRADTAL